MPDKGSHPSALGSALLLPAGDGATSSLAVRDEQAGAEVGAVRDDRGARRQSGQVRPAPVTRVRLVARRRRRGGAETGTRTGTARRRVAPRGIKGTPSPDSTSLRPSLSRRPHLSGKASGIGGAPKQPYPGAEGQLRAARLSSRRG
ncbi:hypothetical protein GCM10017562_74750 [Streptomyces roseofulvus]